LQLKRRLRVASKAKLNETQGEDAPPGFVPSGSVLLDKVLGDKGGWALGRMANLVGDKSTGKTLLAIEACANAHRVLGLAGAAIRYAEAESAFDLPYARTVGCPGDITLSQPGEIRTVEDFGNDLDKHLSMLGGRPGIYVLDSMDSLSSDAEMKRDFGDATYGQEKAKFLSEFFRKRIADIKKSSCLLLIISQIRDKIGVTFGETKQRSGGHALDFYASQVVWLAQVQTLKRTVLGVDRPYGVIIGAKNKKCKVGTPFRDAQLTLLFNYGIDDEASMVDWLSKSNAPIWLPGQDGKLDKWEPKEVRGLIAELRGEQDRQGAVQLRTHLSHVVNQRWQQIEDQLAQPMSKYD
jgi:recombination protein RecA